VVKATWFGPGSIVAEMRRTHWGSPVSSCTPVLLTVMFCGVESTDFAKAASPSLVGG
jgi:hypothetical protein